ncbi:uncharacterized protein MELLADRAFT_63592 [Melampsora larici-populina 98AG31]|uniref:Uncharacterized protein n=1 Tax=Melampsora larici-populina (strain 98AG31 / pathotype 3-4-7) TaxID=747676 RepID=F4RN77_MELLP|nr:uncharacterized protein MELLADRAFT_63592 [Melampsora larici-populina 98AG31]EGG06250.1 hypothetical protein MELLADRAFT_63592 [Melampsora larici-populina 98AG31]
MFVECGSDFDVGPHDVSVDIMSSMASTRSGRTRGPPSGTGTASMYSTRAKRSGRVLASPTRKSTLTKARSTKTTMTKSNYSTNQANELSINEFLPSTSNNQPTPNPPVLRSPTLAEPSAALPQSQTSFDISQINATISQTNATLSPPIHNACSIPSDSNNQLTTNPSILRSPNSAEASVARSQPQTSTDISQINTTISQTKATLSRPIRKVWITNRPRNNGPAESSDEELGDLFNPGAMSDSDLSLEEDSRPSKRQLSQRNTDQAPPASKRSRRVPQNKSQAQLQGVDSQDIDTQDISSSINRNAPLPQSSSSSRATDLPTLLNYQAVCNEWSMTRISAVKRTSSAVPQNIQEEAKALKQLYHHHKEMLAMMGNVTLFTLDKAMYVLSFIVILFHNILKIDPILIRFRGDLGSSRGQGQDGYRLWMSYSKMANKEYRSSKSSTEKEKRQQPADVIKTDLTKALWADLKEALGYSPGKGFPRKPNPGECLKARGFPVNIVQLDGSSLKPEDLALGVDKMPSSKRSLWLNDVKAGLFKLVNDSAVANSSNNINDLNDGGSNPQDIEDDKEPWGVISGLDDNCDHRVDDMYIGMGVDEDNTNLGMGLEDDDLPDDDDF